MVSDAQESDAGTVWTQTTKRSRGTVFTAASKKPSSWASCHSKGTVFTEQDKVSARTVRSKGHRSASLNTTSDQVGAGCSGCASVASADMLHEQTLAESIPKVRAHRLGGPGRPGWTSGLDNGVARCRQLHFPVHGPQAGDHAFRGTIKGETPAGQAKANIKPSSHP